MLLFCFAVKKGSGTLLPLLQMFETAGIEISERRRMAKYSCITSSGCLISTLVNEAGYNCN